MAAIHAIAARSEEGRRAFVNSTIASEMESHAQWTRGWYCHPLLIYEWASAIGCLCGAVGGGGDAAAVEHFKICAGMLRSSVESGLDTDNVRERESSTDPKKDEIIEMWKRAVAACQAALQTLGEGADRKSKKTTKGE